MDTVTYPSEVVQRECEANWLTLKLDVSQRSDLAAMCRVHGIPTAVAIDSSGNLLGKVIGFVEPTSFAARLLQLRAR